MTSLHLAGQILPRGIEAEAEFAREAAEDLHVIGAGRVGLGPRHDCALLDAERVVGDDEVFVEQQFLAETIARRARALRRVEGEQPRLDLGDGEAGDGAREFFAEDDAVGGDARAFHRAAETPLPLAGGAGGGRVRRKLLACFIDSPSPSPSRRREGGRKVRHRALHQIDIGQSLGELQRRLEAFREARRHVGADDEPVDHHFHIMLQFLVERGCFVDFVNLAVDPYARKAGFLPLEQFPAILALAPTHHRREQVQPRARGQRHDAVDHLADGLRGDRQAGRGRIRDADARPQQAHVVVDFGDGRDGRARVAAGGLLLDADRRGQALDMVDIGLLHEFEELAGIGAQGLDIAPLPLGIDRVEREARFAAARQAGDDGERIARNVHADVLEIVLARAAYGNMSQHGAGLFQICSGDASDGLRGADGALGCAGQGFGRMYEIDRDRYDVAAECGSTRCCSREAKRQMVGRIRSKRMHPITHLWHRARPDRRRFQASRARRQP